MNGNKPDNNEIKKFKTMVMLHLGKEYRKRNWVMQIHIGTIRNNNLRMFKKLGPDTGFDAIGDYLYAESLLKLMGKLDEDNNLPKTILYNLNPINNDMLGTFLGCFQSDEIPGKIQLGSGWWFCDHKDGMEKQMIALGNLGLLSRFVGMLTDSRSYLSYTRHEYFRRILCNMLGKWLEDGEMPDDIALAGRMVSDISYNNAVKYFNL
jgi:glucuronate isomerase